MQENVSFDQVTKSFKLQYLNQSSRTTTKQPLTSTMATTNPCRTSSDSPTPNVPCIFPWKFQDKLRQECITDTDPDGKHWCSTKIHPPTLEHIGGEGNWGYCTNSCPPINQCTYFLQWEGVPDQHVCRKTHIFFIFIPNFVF